MLETGSLRHNFIYNDKNEKTNFKHFFHVLVRKDFKRNLDGFHDSPEKSKKNK